MLTNNQLIATVGDSRWAVLSKQQALFILAWFLDSLFSWHFPAQVESKVCETQYIHKWTMCPEKVNWNYPVIMSITVRFTNLEQTLFKQDRHILNNAKEMLKRQKVESFYIYVRRRKCLLHVRNHSLIWTYNDKLEHYRKSQHKAESMTETIHAQTVDAFEYHSLTSGFYLLCVGVWGWLCVSLFVCVEGISQGEDESVVEIHQRFPSLNTRRQPESQRVARPS